ncbi:MAG: ribosome maturation factor RimP [Actinomycetota bacterium]|nr:ribosome maturation factor RimP [Actinomycetota bacterium]
MSTIQADIEARLAIAEPEVDVLLAEVVGAGTLRVFIDHPEGVTIALCERVSRGLMELSATYTVEVSSPGRERPLTRPDHFRSYIGRRARIRTRASLQADRRSYTGELVGASDREVTVAAPDGVVAILYADIQRSNLVGE